ncbi:uncharacterized protein LOC129961651 isoform X2 [Argiope bruennichi]|uniref:Uncharacterized protein n=2 Tax=Argiope bruennichi TaxID=94029 RepID=A0A8T0FX38_ARGBR|nr:uncharacterized protein LOC129961651 isoform X2 [Argiope bruennichi]KAF8794748.1 hypothetical protein HNY73_002690 [Argiope bruennichi]
MSEVASSSCSKGPPIGVNSPPGTSADLKCLSSETLPTAPVQSESFTVSQAATRAKDCCCCEIIDRCFNWCKKNVCPRRNLYNKGVFLLAMITFFVNFIVKRKEDYKPNWEVLYATLLIMYCSLFTCFFERGSYSKSFWLIYPKRKKVDSSPKKSPGQEGEYVTVPETSPTDSIITESPGHGLIKEVKLDVYGVPGTSGIN